MRPVDSLFRLGFLVLLAGFFVFFSVRTSVANDQQKELKAQAEGLLAKSHDLSNIEAPGSPAFVLNATIHYQIGTQPAEGQAQIIWMAPDHYRAIYTVSDYSDEEIVQDGKQYLARTHDDLPLVIYELHTMIADAMNPFPDQKDEIKKVEAAPAGSAPWTCVTFKSGKEDCLDTEGDVVTKTFKWPNQPALNSRYEFSNFAPLGTKRFPQKLLLVGGDGDAIDISVFTLAPTNNTKEQNFGIPLHSVVQPWCASPTIEAMQRDLSSVAFRAGHEFGYLQAALYVVVAPGGRARFVRVIYSSQPISDEDMQNWMNGTRFPIHSCGGDGVEYQFKLSLRQEFH
jgi:hypothetical protein